MTSLTPTVSILCMFNITVHTNQRIMYCACALVADIGVKCRRAERYATWHWMASAICSQYTHCILWHL